MVKKFFDKFLGFFYDEEEEIEDVYDDENDTYDLKKKKTRPVVSLHTQKQVKVVIVEPKMFEDSQHVADNLKNRRPVIVNLENAEKELAKRVVDFVSGTTYALNGGMQKIGNGVFLFTPENIDISAEQKDEIKERGLFFWQNKNRDNF